MNMQNIAPVAIEVESVTADGREALRADLMALADALDEQREVTQLFADSDADSVPEFVRSYLCEVESAFDCLVALVDGLAVTLDSRLAVRG
jgi:hypothetical protein